MQGCLQSISSKEEPPLCPAQILASLGAGNLLQNTAKGQARVLTSIPCKTNEKIQ